MREPSNKTSMTADQYLKFEESSREKHEYVAGQIFVMTGRTLAHSAISGNIYYALRGYLRGSGCRVYADQIKVKVETLDCFHYPDIVVTCQPFDPKSQFAEKPTLIVEVLSPSTKHIDRREKLMAYRQLASVRQYVIVHQNRQRLEVHQRNESGGWDTHLSGRSDSWSMNSLGKGTFEIPVSTVYEDAEVPFTVEEEEEDYAFS